VGKHPKFKEAPKPYKAARFAPSAAESDERKPLWSLAVLDQNGPWGWCKVEGAAILCEIHATLRNYESMEWNHILHKTGSHSIARYKLCKEAQTRLEEIGQADIDDLICLRKEGSQRIWGIKDRHILRVLWWDPDHGVYPVEKQHT
jgi:hypothetical protein